MEFPETELCNPDKIFFPGFSADLALKSSEASFHETWCLVLSGTLAGFRNFVS